MNKFNFSLFFVFAAFLAIWFTSVAPEDSRVGKNDIVTLPSVTITSTSPYYQTIGTEKNGQTGYFHYQTDADDAGDTTFITIQGRNSTALPWEDLRIDTMVGDGSKYFSYAPPLALLREKIVTQDTTAWDAAVLFE